jgi:hypothetical protein
LENIISVALAENTIRLRIRTFIILMFLAIVFLPTLGGANDNPPTTASNTIAIDQAQSRANCLWSMIAAFLVFFMQPRFTMVETGFTRANNAANIMMKI